MSKHLPPQLIIIYWPGTLRNVTDQKHLVSLKIPEHCAWVVFSFRNTGPALKVSRLVQCSNEGQYVGHVLIKVSVLRLYNEA